MSGHLTSLSPIGETPLGLESFTSYVRRLARVEYVSPSIMLRELVLEPRRRRLGHRHLLVEPTRVTESLNGASQTTRVLVSGVAVLTRVPRVATTTLLDCDTAIAFDTAFRRWRAWCPRCLRVRSDDAYDRLYWSLTLVTTCAAHGVRIIDRCAACGRPHRPIHARADPETCPHCGALLANANDVRSKDLRTSTLLLELLGGCVANRLERTGVAASIRRAVDGEGGLTRASRRTGLARSELSLLRRGLVRPQLGSVMRLLVAFDMDTNDLMQPAAHTSAPTRRTPGRPPQAALMPALEAQLRGALACAEPPSLRSFAREIGLDPSTIARHEPTLAQALVVRRERFISLRRRAREVRERALVLTAFDGLRRLGMSASKRQIGQRLAKPGILRARHIRDALLVHAHRIAGTRSCARSPISTPHEHSS